MRPFHRRAGAVCSAALLGLVALSACGSSGGTAPKATAADGSCTKPTSLRTSLVALYPLIKVGNDQGIFAKHCLNVTDTQAVSPVAAIPAILGGSVDLTMLPLASLITSLNQKLPLTIVAPGAAIPADAAKLPAAKVDAAGVFVPKGSTITKPAQLAGKSVAVPGLGTSMQTGVIAAVKADGGDPSTIKWVQLDSQTEVQQLKAGKVDAASIAIPFATQLAAGGYKRVASPSLALYGTGIPYTPWVTSKKDFASKSDAFKRFREAILEVQAYSTAHMDVYQQAQATVTKLPVAAIEAGPQTWFATDIDNAAVVAFANRLKTLGVVNQVPDLTNVVATYK